MHIGERIRQLRQERNVTAEQLAVRLGKGSATVVRWERGETSPRVKDLLSIGAELNLTLAHMVRGVTEDTSID